MNLLYTIVLTVIAVAFIFTAMRDWNRLVKHALGTSDEGYKAHQTYIAFQENSFRWLLSVRLRILFGFLCGAFVMSCGPNDEFILEIFLIFSFVGVLMALGMRNFSFHRTSTKRTLH